MNSGHDVRRHPDYTRVVPRWLACSKRTSLRVTVFECRSKRTFLLQGFTLWVDEFKRCRLATFLGALPPEPLNPCDPPLRQTLLSSDLKVSNRSVG